MQREGIALVFFCCFVIAAGQMLSSAGFRCNSALAYRLPDSGQTKCYDILGSEIVPCPAPGQSYYGQDGNYRGPQMAFEDNGDGTVTDLNTGLMWEKRVTARTSTPASGGRPKVTVNITAKLASTRTGDCRLRQSSSP